MAEHVDVYRDGQGTWRWRRVTANGNIIADSGEGYHNRSDCVTMAEKINEDVPVEILSELDPTGTEPLTKGQA